MGNVDQLAAGRAFADLSSWRKVAVTGADAAGWLDDLVTADLSGLSQGGATRSLLLSPTGKVRAEFTVALPEQALLLVQDPTQRSIGELLSPYVLSSDVSLEDRTDRLALIALPRALAPPPGIDAAGSSPSCLGPGIDLFAPSEAHGALLDSLAGSVDQASLDDVEAWRVFAGIPRLGIDVTEDDLPQEGGLDEFVAFDKGCYLGQESVAKVRNLGHPRRVLLRLEADRDVAAGEAVLVDGREAGAVSSAARLGGRTAILARVRWDAREGSFRTRTGVDLRPSSPPQSPV
jgi:folate-binding protein YgfZ